MRGVLLLAAFAGCYQRGELCTDPDLCPDNDAPTPGDTSVDMQVFTCPGGTSFGSSSLVKICIPEEAIVPAAFPLNGVFDSTAEAGCNQRPTIDGVEVCVRWANNITIGNGVVTGSRPVVLLARESITIPNGGRLDASSSSDNSQIGAGATRNDCAGAPGTGTDGGGGGAGGRFEGLAGNGGDGGNGIGGMAAAPHPLVFRAGCRGGVGGADPSQPNNGGLPGGAVFLIAGSTILIEAGAHINASGGGGKGSNRGSGGNGGGSGGFIGLDAPTISMEGQLFALGGGGGAGGGDSATDFGPPGTTATGPLSPAGSATGPDNCQGLGGAGAAHSVGAANGGNTTNVLCGGGGGGGSVGVIGYAGGLLNASDLDIAPPPQALP